MEIHTILRHWCRFVLEEGIMPPVITRKLNAADINLSENAALLADILNKRENFRCPAELSSVLDGIETVMQTAFLSDPELVGWLDKVSILLEVISVYGRTDNALTDMEDVVDGACKSFIKSCYLVTQAQKDRYAAFSRATSLSRSLSDDEHQRQAFAYYLRHESPKKYEPNTINSYISNLNGLLKQPEVNVNIWGVDDPQVLRELLQRLYTVGNFQGRYPVALDRYMEFLVFKHNGETR